MCEERSAPRLERDVRLTDTRAMRRDMPGMKTTIVMCWKTVGDAARVWRRAGGMD
jgi:hypothetical protein